MGARLLRDVLNRAGFAVGVSVSSILPTCVSRNIPTP